MQNPPGTLASILWTDLALSSNAGFIAVQFAFLGAVSAFRIRRLIDTRIGGLDAIEVRSWPRLITGTVACNAAFLLMHHLYISFGPSKESRAAFVGFHLLTMIIVSISVVPLLGILFDGGNAIWVRTGKFKPEHSPMLIDMTEDQGRSAQLIPRGAIFAYQLLMIFTWITLFSKQGTGPGT